jgi:uracil-DNA glycosylase family 4
MNAREVDLDCARCRLSETRTQVVPGSGDRRAALAFIGEAPGKDEDLKGAPFVGRAGRILDDALAHAGVSRDMVFVTNLVKCRPPGNRRPREDETSACKRQLDAELRAVRPKVVCLLGQTVARRVLEDRSPMKAIAGKERKLAIAGREVRVFVAYHPAACLYRRENVKSLRETVRLCTEAAGLR